MCVYRVAAGVYACLTPVCLYRVQPAINHLVSALSGGPGDGAASNKKRKKKEGPAPIHRPVICICNDPYVPALRPLRQMALVMTFPPTAGER